MLILISFSTQLLGQEIGEKAKVIAHYDSVNKVFPKEKLYLHLDKSVYAPSDTLWFKAYLINPSTNAYSSLSGLVYIDVVNADGTIVQSISLPARLGISWGSLALNPKIYENGNYTIRGYTNWMQNFGETFFFKKQIKILKIPFGGNSQNSSSSPITTSKPLGSNALITDKGPSIQFLPEGGTWIVGRLQKIAFKAIAQNGKGIAIEGEIKDSKLKPITSFKSNAKGMGYFSLFTEPEETYTAYIKIGKANYTQVLTNIKATGTSLFVKNDYSLDSLIITVLSDVANQELTMIGQAKGLICFSANFAPNINRKTIKIAKNLFPTGIGQIILQNREQVLNERNFFINHQDQLSMDLKSSLLSYGQRDSIPIHFKVNDAKLKPIAGSFSIAVTDDGQVMKNEKTDLNILSYFLLSSDLKGEIEDPNYYFDGFNAQKHDDLEALCLTQGWVSYNWDLNKKATYRIEKEYTISGKINNLANKPVANAKVSIFGRNKVMMYGDTTTNEKGEFVFRNLPPMDSAVFVLKVVNSKGRLGSLGFEVNEFKPLTVKSSSVKMGIANVTLDSIELNFVAVKQQEYKANQANGIALNEVNILGKKIVKNSKNLNGPGEADQTITAEELAKAGKKTLLHILQEKVKGFNEVVDKDYFISFNRLKVVIDGIDLDLVGIPDNHYRHLKSYFDYYTAEDLEGIEVMRHIGKASAYKLEFDNITDKREIAYLEITTKSGAGPFSKKTLNTYLIKPRNYGDNKVFYSPTYTIANRSNKRPDVRSTIYWAPNVVTNSNGEASFSFFSADKKGIYTVWIEGSDMLGKFVAKTIKLKIN